MDFLLRGTIWEKGALRREPKKYRSLTRVWLPIYDGIAIAAGILAAVFGSRLLDGIYGGATDLIGILFAVVAFFALAGVAYPYLWRLEIAAKCVMLGMLSSYIAAILVAPTPEQLAFRDGPAWFVAAMIVWGFPLAGFRLTQVAVEEFDRRVAARVEELKKHE